jgi:hypothetical protein
MLTLAPHVLQGESWLTFLADLFPIYVSEEHQKYTGARSFSIRALPEDEQKEIRNLALKASEELRQERKAAWLVQHPAGLPLEVYHKLAWQPVA